jgi:hypothetical protein
LLIRTLCIHIRHYVALTGMHEIVISCARPLEDLDRHQFTARCHTKMLASTLRIAHKLPSPWVSELDEVRIKVIERSSAKRNVEVTPLAQ